MIFHKVPYVQNFEFARKFDRQSNSVSIGGKTYNVLVETFPGDIFHVQMSQASDWTENLSLVELNRPTEGASVASFEISDTFEFAVKGASGKSILSSAAGMGFGVMGRQAVFCFNYHAKQEFYGLGEKTFGQLNMPRMRTRFWNTDALGDFDYTTWDKPLDPYYSSVPYLIVRDGDHYVGLLYENPYPTFIDTGSDPSFFQTEDAERKIVIGSEDGLPSLWIIVGPTLAELTAKLQKLVGTTPVPPTWALGYHQCRWGYKGEADIVRLDGLMEKHEIPNDGLWLDIDYMNGYRVFTYSEEHFPNGVPAAIKKVAKNRRRVVPIIDPGVKIDPGYEVYDSGKKAGVFCLNPQGKDFVGFVWPGRTAFPDFSMKEGREWWAQYAASFRSQGFAGAWLDMNDPSTGSVDPDAMLFRKGQVLHGGFRNQYALGMQMATREAFQKAEPNQRVFLLSRSGFTGTSRYSAIWTGDNLATRFYLKGSIPTTLNLGLSGIPFNGPDVGGFMHDTSEELMLDWVKAGFLFPFFRIHSVQNNRPQEPWAFSRKALRIIRHYIRLRYRLLPYLYNVFLEQNEVGHPILRPLQYQYEKLGSIDDQFLVGDAILQAPNVEGEASREYILPGRTVWYDAALGDWVPAKRHAYEANEDTTPLFFRNGAIVPCLPGERTTNEKDLSNVEVHVFLHSGTGETIYQFDDGETMEYEKGKRSAVKVTAKGRGGVLELMTETLKDGFGPLNGEFVVYGSWRIIRLNGKRVRAARKMVKWTGTSACEAKSFPIR